MNVKAIWSAFSQIHKSTLAIDQLQEHLPESFTEKALKAELIDLLENHETFSRELEQEFSAVTRLKKQAINSVLRDVSNEPAVFEDLPIIQEIKSILDRCSK